jgi:hypothetical protein
MNATELLRLDSTTARIQQLVERHARWGEDRRRLERAAMIVLFRQILPQPDGSYLVESEEKPGTFHRVLDQCSCPDAQKRGVERCKHVLAMLLARQLGWEVQAPPIPVRPRSVEAIEQELYG